MTDDKTRISSYRRVVPMIYAYQTPGYPKHDGWTKIGETKNGVERRIKQQVHTAWIDYELMWQDNALFKDGSGEFFSDHDFHDFLERSKKVERNPGTEWFRIDGPQSLMYFDDFANNLRAETAAAGGTPATREENIRRLLNFFPVIAEDEEGKMVEIDARQVLSIPRSIKSQEVVSRGFLCNFLFKNIANIFGAPSVVQGILEKLDKALEDRGRNTNATLSEAGQVQVDGEGNVQVPDAIIIGQEQDVFGDKVYESFETLKDECSDIAREDGQADVVRSIGEIEANIVKAIFF